MKRTFIVAVGATALLIAANVTSLLLLAGDGDPAPVGAIPPPADLLAGLIRLEERIEACAGIGAIDTGANRPVFRLALEPTEGAVTVVGASVQGNGPANDDFAACVLERVVGQRIPVSVAHAGLAFELPFEPRSPRGIAGMGAARGRGTR